jgi:hypothetical protein
MRSLVFFYNNQWHSGRLLKSRSNRPQLYWFMFDTHLLAGDTDQYLCFVLQEGKVLPTKEYDQQYYPMIESIQAQIEQLIIRENFRKGS